MLLAGCTNHTAGQTMCHYFVAFIFIYNNNKLKRKCGKWDKNDQTEPII